MSSSFEIITVDLSRVVRVTKTKVSVFLEQRDVIDTPAVLPNAPIDRRVKVAAITDGAVTTAISVMSDLLYDGMNSHDAKALVEQRIGKMVDCDLYRLSERDLRLIVAGGKELVSLYIDDPIKHRDLSPLRIMTVSAALQRILLTIDLHKYNVFVRANG